MSRKIEIASVFELDQSTADYVRQSAGHFITFSRTRQIFSLSCDDDEAPKAVARALRAIYETGGHTDLTEEPKLRRLPGTGLTNAVQLLRARHLARNRKGGELLAYSESDSDSESEVVTGISHNPLTWSPKNGTLPDSTFIADALHGLHCIVDRNDQEKHVDLRGVDAAEAFERLTKLEDLLVLRKAPIRKNIFILEGRRDFHRFETPALRDHLQLGSRIIVPDDSEPEFLLNKHISRLKFLTIDGLKTPPSLENPEKPHSRPEQSSLWNDRTFQQIHNERLPDPPKRPAKVLEEVEVPRDQSLYLSRDKSQAVSKWAGNISPTGPPDTVAVPPEAESRFKVGKQRQVLDSEDESSDTSEPAIVPAETDWDLDYLERRDETDLNQNQLQQRNSIKKDTLIDVETSKAAPWPKKSYRTIPNQSNGSKVSQSPSTQSLRGSNALYVTTELPKPKHAHITREKVQALEARIAEKKAVLKPVPRADGGPLMDAEKPLERLQQNDEVSSRKIINTTSQKAGKGRQKKNKLAVDQKRQNVLAESWGAPSTTMPAGGPTLQTTEPCPTKKPITLRGRESETPQVDELNTSAATRVSEELLSVFDPLRAFSGRIGFSVQLGQILISGSRTNSIGDNSTHDFKEWDEMFNPSHGRQPPATIFTNHLTTNGKDIDHILNLQHHETAPAHSDPWADASAVFKRDPEERVTTYEFHCQSKDNESFILVITEDGEVEVVKPSLNLASINLHYVGQIWDARALVTGSEPFVVSPALGEAVEDLRENLCVSGGRTQLELTYLRPQSSEIRIEKIKCIRKTRHDCLKYPMVVMETALIQDLVLQNRSDNPDFCRAFAKPYAQMVSSDRLRWNVSFSSRDISAAFMENDSLILGNIVNRWTASALLFEETSAPPANSSTGGKVSKETKRKASPAIKSLVALTSLIVKQIDGVGYNNIGSLCRLAEKQGGSLLYNAGLSSQSQKVRGKNEPGRGIEVKGALGPGDSASQAGGQNSGERMRVTYQPGCGAKVVVSERDFW